jgi:hypothetical protein
MLIGDCAYHVEVEEVNESEALALLRSKLHRKVIYTDNGAKEPLLIPESPTLGSAASIVASNLLICIEYSFVVSLNACLALSVMLPIAEFVYQSASMKIGNLLFMCLKASGRPLALSPYSLRRLMTLIPTLTT